MHGDAPDPDLERDHELAFSTKQGMALFVTAPHHATADINARSCEASAADAHAWPVKLAEIVEINGPAGHRIARELELDAHLRL